jgi:GTPase SAR1 family protein
LQLLEYFYDRNNEITDYFQRKVSIDKSIRKILIYGSPSSGKSYLVLDYLMNFEKEDILYIDFQDPKFQFIDIISEDIDSFIETNNIKIVVLDHYEHLYFDRLPNSLQLIIISDRFYDYGYDFDTIEVSLLDYEEFFAFQKNISQKHLFNLFLRQGTLPQLSTQTIPREQLFKLFIHSHFDESQQRLLNVLAHFNSSIVTTFQLYNYAKERYKISKDLIYKQIREFIEIGVISFIPDYINLNSKKLLFFDFALAKYLALSQSFPKQFDTMVALSLKKHNIEFKAFGINGYITNNKILTIPAPFENEDSLWKKAHNKFGLYIKNGIKKVYIITVAIQYEFRIEDIVFEALPFYEWVVISDEYNRFN